MKRLALAMTLVAFVGCKKAEQTPPPADTTAAPAAAPAPAMDSSKMTRDTSKAAAPAAQAPATPGSKKPN